MSRGLIIYLQSFSVSHFDSLLKRSVSFKNRTMGLGNSDYGLGKHLWFKAYDLKVPNIVGANSNSSLFLSGTFFNLVYKDYIIRTM